LRSLYILDINSFSAEQQAKNTFFCLFILVIVSFAVQKFFNL
jgi:hypothetical protein